MNEIFYNSNPKNFNRYHLEYLTDTELIEYAKILVVDASEKEQLMNENDSYNNSYNFSVASTNISQIIEHINERGLKAVNFKFGFDGLTMYGCNHIKGLLDDLN